MYSPDDFIPISALQHYRFCPRQCALIHIERIWDENLHTAEGRILHEKADSGKSEKRGDIKKVSGLWLCSGKLGLSGRADMVEFHRREGIWHPFPVEYKRGRPKTHNADLLQLCAQAICLEEMLGLPVPEGALFYGKTRRRLAVKMSSALRASTSETAEAVHRLLRGRAVPLPAADDRCAACSLADQCLPRPISRRGAASRYLRFLQAEP